jgi:glycosyltransferase involved in cell wall biosynthesis
MSTAISVAMAAYNGERFIAEQLASILAQLRAGDEVLVVDDASTDRTLDVVASLQDGRVRVLRNERNAGVFSAFERALRATRGDIIYLSDQDDVWLPGKVVDIMERFERDPEVLLVLSDAQVIDDTGRVIEPSFMALRGGFRGSFVSTLVRNRYLGCTMALRRSLLSTVLPIPPDVPMHDMWFGSLAVLQGRVDYIDRPLMQYRRHGSNVSPSRRQSVGQMLRWRWRLLSNVMRRRGSLRAARSAEGPVP